MDLWTQIATRITDATGTTFRLSGTHSVGGGCINATEVLEGDGRRYFVKLNDAARLDMFEAEAAGLQEIVDSDTIRAPCSRRPSSIATQRLKWSMPALAAQ